MALLVLAAGYAVAIANLYFTYSMMDGRAGVTVEDMKRAFHGPRTVTRLAAKIDGGSMEQYLPNPLNKAKILNWIQDGTSRETFDKEISLILSENCWRCHNPNGFMYKQPLQTHEQVLEVTQVDRGEPTPVWARVAHTHLQSIALIFFLVGGVFAATSLPEGVKALIIVSPFAALVVDFGSRFLARYHSGFVYPMMAAGAVAALAFATMVLLSLYQIWWRRG